MEPLKFIVSVVSFVLIVVVYVLLVRQSKDKHKIYWLIACSIGSLVWLGLAKGVLASLLATAVTSGYVSTRLDARRVGKKIAHSIGMSHKLFFTCLEQTLPLYLHALADLHRQGLSVDEARMAVLPYVVGGLDVLESKFGPQALITAARLRISPFLEEVERT